MKICIISDLHCRYKQDTSSSSDSLLTSTKPRIPANQHPVAAMINAVKNDESLKADILICLGDLGDKADEQGIISAWNFVAEIKNNLGAKLMIGLPGNHDINSRKVNGKDAFSFIKTFYENFPTNEDNCNTKFWELGYCFVKHEDSLILMINTTHDHYDVDKAKKSTLKDGSLEKIEMEIKQIGYLDFSYKICILHHHPIKHSNINNYSDSDSFEKGDDLINLLNKYNFNIVIHGHKHQPRIADYCGLPILASGSFSSFANLNGTGLNTMFHVLELFKNSKKGFIDSWEFDIKNGWNKNYNKNFPPRIGFGATLNISVVADKINEVFQSHVKRPFFYQEIIDIIPEIEYLIPDYLIQLDEILRTKYSIMAKPEFPLQPNMLTELIK